jgi:hypothetical protein
LSWVRTSHSTWWAAPASGCSWPTSGTSPWESGLEATVFHAVNDLPELLYRPMWLVQLLGVLFVPAAGAVIAALLRKWRLAAAPRANPTSVP